MNRFKNHYLILLIILLGIFLRFYQLSGQPPLEDEVTLAYQSISYWKYGFPGDVMWWHPRLNDSLVYIGTRLFGFTALGIKSYSLFAGILTIFLTYLLAWLITNNRSVSTLAALFIATDPVHIFLSRLPLQEAFATALLTVSLICMILYLKNNNPWWVLACGLSIGLSLGIKWYAVPLILGFSIILILHKNSFSLFQKTLLAISSFIIAPFGLYIFSFISWFKRGYSLPEWVQLQKLIFNETINYAGNPNSNFLPHKAWQWFVKPTIYANFVLSENKPYVIAAISNPLIWLTVLPVITYIILKIIKAKEYIWITPVIYFLLLYLPFLISTRPVWLFSALPLTPAFYTLLSYTFIKISYRSSIHNRIIILFLISGFLVNFLLYPIAIGQGLEYKYTTIVLNFFPSP